MQVEKHDSTNYHGQHVITAEADFIDYSLSDFGVLCFLILHVLSYDLHGSIRRERRARTGKAPSNSAKNSSLKIRQARCFYDVVHRHARSCKSATTVVVDLRNYEPYQSQQ
jgi:hypothetical protein